MILSLIVMFSVAFAAGTVVHEGTHWAVAKSLGADIHSVSLLPPYPEVVYVASTPGVDRLIRVSTVIASVPLLVVLLWIGRGRPLVQQLTLAVFAIAYLPRSATDWEPVARVFKCIAV